MQDAVNKNLQKIIEDKKEKEAKKQDELKGIKTNLFLIIVLSKPLSHIN